jgi:hypothetical protein
MEDRPITPEQARLAVEAAGLDPGRPISEQVSSPADVEALTSRIAAVEQTLEAGQQPADRQPTEQQFATNYRDALNAARTRWFGESEEPDDAAA